MKRYHLIVCIESPLAGDYKRNIAYARACMAYCLQQGAAPVASHLLYTQVLNDKIPEQREVGLLAGLALGDSCQERWFFTDFGMSPGMTAAMARAMEFDQPTRDIELGENWSKLRLPKTKGAR